MPNSFARRAEPSRADSAEGKKGRKEGIKWGFVAGSVTIGAARPDHLLRKVHKYGKTEDGHSCCLP